MYDASKFFNKKEITYGTGAINQLMAEQINPIIDPHFDAIVENKYIATFRTKLQKLFKAKDKNKKWFNDVCDLCTDFTDLGTNDYFEIGCDAGLVVMFYLLLQLEKEENDTIVPTIPDLHITSYTKDIDVIRFGKRSKQQMFILEFKYQGEYMTICDMKDVMVAEDLITTHTNFITLPYITERVTFGSSLDEMLFNEECYI